MVAKPVKSKTVAKAVTAPVAKAAVVAKPVVAAVAAKTAQPESVVPAPSASASTVVKTMLDKTIEAVKAPVQAIITPRPSEGTKVMNDTVTKVQETAQKFTADATARASEMFGDVSARAKTAMEKGSKGLEDIVDFSKGNLEAIVTSGRVAAKGAQDIAKYSADYGRKSIEDANANAKKFAAVKSPTEFFALQSEVAKTSLDAMVGEASKFAEGYMKLLGEIVQPIQNRYAVAVEKVKTAVAA